MEEITKLRELEKYDLMTDGDGEDFICIGVTDELVFLAPYIEATKDGEKLLEIDMLNILAFDLEQDPEDGAFKPVQKLFVGYDEQD